MGLTFRYCLLLLLAIILKISTINAEQLSIQIENPRDYEVLQQFFRMGFSEEEYGYVLEGAKPISIRNFYSLNSFPIYKDVNDSEKEFLNTLLVQEAIPIWNRLYAQQKNFFLKFVDQNDLETTLPGYEVQFINISLLTRVIDQNIDLFRYVLGPSINTESLVDRILHSHESLTEILHNNVVLIGIVLGFGPHNSLVEGRIDTLLNYCISQDCPPFLPKSSLMQSKENHSLSFLTPERYGGYYLEFAGGNDTIFRYRSNSFSPSFNSDFSSLENEIVSLDHLREPLPSSLMERPAFIYGLFKGGPSNDSSLKRLEYIQKKIQNLLKRPDFLEIILQKIGGKKPLIECDKPPFTDLFSLLHKNLDIQSWIHILQDVASRFEDQEQRKAFIDTFCHPSQTPPIPPKMIGASKATLEGLKKALKNLASAEAHFDTLSKDVSLQAIVPKRLYFKIVSPGTGKEVKGATHVRLGYTIEDPEGNILFANHDTWLNLSQILASLAHGMQGMRVGEKRIFFIHPAFGYGALTTLPPCIELTIKIHVLDTDEKMCGALPLLTPCNLDWIQDPSFYSAVEESVQRQPSFIGAFYQSLVSKMEEIDRKKLISSLKCDHESHS